MGCHQKQLQADRPSYSNYSTLATSFFVFLTIAQLTNSFPQVPTSFATTASTKQSEQRRSKTGSGSGLDFHLTNLTRAKTDQVATPSIVAGAHRHHRHRHQPKIVREYGLLSHCSNKYVQVTGKRVDSKAGPNDQYALLRVETVDDGFGSQLKIQGSRSQNYLCFNRKGKLTVRASGGDAKCVFRELLSVDLHAEFQSAFDESWFVAFNHNGRSMDGDFLTKRPRQLKCRYFIKKEPPVEMSDTQKTKKSKKQGPEVDFDRLPSRLKLPPKSEQI